MAHRNFCIPLKLKLLIMKKITNLLLTLILGFGVSSCYDDDPINKFPVQGLTDITLSIASTNNVTGEGFGVPFTATIPQAYTEDVTVEALLKFVNGESRNTITIPAGSTSASGNVNMQADDGLIDFNGRAVTLSMSGFSLDDNAQVGQPAAFNISSNEVSLTSYDLVQWDYDDGVVASRATMLFDWVDPASKDFDTRVFDSAFNLVEDAGSGSRYETDILNDTHPDGDYFLVVDIFSGSGDTPWKFFFVHPDQTTVEVFEGVFTAAEVASGIVFPVIEWTKSTDINGNVSYVVTKP